MITEAEWARAAWGIQSWARSCWDACGCCLFCGSRDPREHVSECPWPAMRTLLDKTEVEP